MTTICWDVDTQTRLHLRVGMLSVPGAERLIPNLQAAHRLGPCQGHSHRRHGRRSSSRGPAEISDTPDWTTTFPPHCMRATPGQRKIAETTLRNPMIIEPEPLDAGRILRRGRARTDGDILLHKPGTDVFHWNPNAATVLDALAPDRSLSTAWRPTSVPGQPSPGSPGSGPRRSC